MAPSTVLIRGLAVAALMAVLADTPSAFAADRDGPLDAAFGNVIVSTHPDGRQAKLWLKRDGAYDAQGRAGERSGGVWRLKGDKLCLSQRRPFPIPFSYCKAVPPVSVGKPWRDKAFNGDLVTNEVVPGDPPSASR